MKRSIAALWFGGASLALAAACSSSEGDATVVAPAPTPDDGGPSDAGALSLALSAACTDTVESIYDYAETLAPSTEARGDILRCFAEAPVGKDALAAKLTASGYKGRPPTSGAKVYRVLYRTERGDAASTPSVSSALVLLPDAPRNTTHLPVVVAARGSRGQAASCAASKRDPAADDGLHNLMYPLVGLGYAVIVPDLAGYANYGKPGNPPSAYAQAQDVGRSTLDGGRALKKLVPGLDANVVLVGHSQGGFSALAALALVDSYGTAGPVAGVAAFAPLWLSQRSWGAVLNSIVASSYPFTSSPAGPVSVWYHYTEAELLDGPGEGLKLFKPEAREGIQAFVDNDCWGSKYPRLEALGANAAELFDPAFVASISGPAAFGDACKDATCEKWIARYGDDRPHLTGTAATTPIYLLYGNKDTTIPTGRFPCAVDRLNADKANLAFCVEPDEDHGGIVERRADMVTDWIGNLTLGEPAPAACPLATSGAIVDDKGFLAQCEPVPPND